MTDEPLGFLVPPQPHHPWLPDSKPDDEEDFIPVFAHLDGSLHLTPEGVSS